MVWTASAGRPAGHPGGCRGPAYDPEMPFTAPLATETCQQTSAAATAVGLVFLVAVVGAVVGLAIANSRSRTRLATANAELAWLRPEYARLQQWVATAGTGGPSSAYTGADGPTAGWHPDPSGRHELRYWDGAQWREDVSDHGQSSKDPTP